MSFRADSLAQSTNRKTIPPPAISDALRDLEFEHFIPRVEAELKKYNEMQTGKRNAYRRKVREEKKDGGRGEEVEVDGSSNGDDGERATKRVRRSSQDEGDESMDGTATRTDTSPSAQLRNGVPLESMDPPDEEGGYNEDNDNDDDDDDDDDQEAGNDEADEEEPDEEDDEDEYPDEGRRLSSLEPEPDDDHDSRKRRGVKHDGSDVSMSGDEGSD